MISFRFALNKYLLYAHQNTRYNIDINLKLNTSECCAEERKYFNILQKLRCVMTFNSLLFSISWHLQNLRRWVDNYDSSWQSTSWAARWCWSMRSSRTWLGPRTWWTPWSQWAQSCPGLWGQMPPRTGSAMFPRGWNNPMFRDNQIAFDFKSDWIN